MKKKHVLLRIIAFFSILLIILFTYTYFHQKHRSEFVKYWYFKRNLERVNQAVILYAQKNDSEMPSASKWGDLVKNKNQLILKEDFITPMSYPDFGIYFNKALERRILI